LGFYDLVVKRETSMRGNTIEENVRRRGHRKM